MAKVFDPMIGKNTQFKAGEEQAKISMQGAEASREARKQRKMLGECAKVFGELEVSDSVKKEMAKLKIPEEFWVRVMQPVVALYNKANKGDVAAFNAIRDIIGEKPVDKSQVTGAIDTRIEIGYVETGVEPVSSEEDVEV